MVGHTEYKNLTHTQCHYNYSKHKVQKRQTDLCTAAVTYTGDKGMNNIKSWKL